MINILKIINKLKRDFKDILFKNSLAKVDKHLYLKYKITPLRSFRR